MNTNFVTVKSRGVKCIGSLARKMISTESGIPNPTTCLLSRLLVIQTKENY